MKNRIIALALVAASIGMAAPAQAAPVKERTVLVSYNAALSMHEAAMPPRYKVGDKFRICYRQECVTVRAIYGGCTCLDISDEGMNYLASTGKGVIKATVSER